MFITILKEWLSFYRVIVEGPGDLDCCVLGLGDFVSTFRANLPPSSAGFWENSRTYDPEHKGGTFIRNVGKQLPNQTAQQPRDLLFHYDNKLTTNKTLYRLSCPRGYAASFPHDLSRILCYEPHTLEERETIRKNTVEKQHCLLSVSLPHSHDSNGKVWQQILRKPSLMAEVLYKLHPHEAIISKNTDVFFISFQ